MMENITLKDIAAFVQGGGSLALLVCAYFIMKCSERLARIEKALQLYMDDTTVIVERRRRGGNATPENN